MRNNYICTTAYFSKLIFSFLLIIYSSLYLTPANAQSLYRVVSASKVDLTASKSVETDKEVKIEGNYLIKNGQLDEIYNLKFVLPTAQLNEHPIGALIKDKKITFEQTRVMVLPIMSMVHFVGILDVDGVQSTTSFQLAFLVNSDDSITFKGTKSFKWNDFIKDSLKDELKLDIDFVLKNNKSDLAVLMAK